MTDRFHSMSADITHPSGERLRAFVVNELEPAERALVRNHLRCCMVCRDAVRKLEATGDPVVETRNPRREVTDTATKPLLDLNSTEPSFELLPADLLSHPRFN